MTLDVSRIATRLREGGGLTGPERQAILECQDPISLGMLAEAIRRRRHGARVTFLRVVEVDVDAGPPDAVGGPVGEWRIVGPLTDPVAVGRVVEATARAAGSTPVSGFSLSDLDAWSTAQSRPLADTLRLLGDRGLERIAEAPIDVLAQPERALEAVLEAGLATERLSVRHLVDDWHALCARLESVRRSIGPLGRFAPLPRSPEPQTSTGYDDVRQIAWARLLVDGVDSIQVDWTLHGPKLAQVALAFGADDIDAVVPETSPESPRRTLVAEIRRNVEAASFEAVERDGRSEMVEP